MPSPFHQKYSSQNHKFYGDTTIPDMPEGPKEQNDRRGSDASMGSNTGSPTDRRRSSTTNRYAALEALKRPSDPESTQRRSSLQDSYGKPGFLGSMWNNFTRGPTSPPAKVQQPKEVRDTSTLRQ